MTEQVLVAGSVSMATCGHHKKSPCRALARPSCSNSCEEGQGCEGGREEGGLGGCGGVVPVWGPPAAAPAQIAAAGPPSPAAGRAAAAAKDAIMVPVLRSCCFSVQGNDVANLSTVQPLL